MPNVQVLRNPLDEGKKKRLRLKSKRKPVRLVLCGGATRDAVARCDSTRRHHVIGCHGTVTSWHALSRSRMRPVLGVASMLGCVSALCMDFTACVTVSRMHPHLLVFTLKFTIGYVLRYVLVRRNNIACLNSQTSNPSPLPQRPHLPLAQT